MDERQKRILSAIVGGLIGFVITGVILAALMDDPVVAWISATITFVVMETVVIYMVRTRVAVSPQGRALVRVPTPSWVPRLLRVAGWFFLVLGALGFVGHLLQPDQAGTPELGAYGGWILDGMCLLLGSGALLLRKRLLDRRDSPAGS